MFEYQLIRSKRRKTLGLQVKHGQVTVRAPHYVTSTFIDTFIQQKSAWLRAKVIEQKDQVNFCDFSHGSKLLFLGEELTLNISVAKHPRVSITDNLESHCLAGNALMSNASPRQTESSNFQALTAKFIHLVISERVNAKIATALARDKQVKKQLESYFKEQAELLINERLELLSKQTALTPTNINIRQYKARWGSCNNRGEVSFNYLLMMAPLFVIDYVIIHELCHLEYLDHSRHFWQLVEKHLPSYQLAKQWLVTHQSQLHWKNPT